MNKSEFILNLKYQFLMNGVPESLRDPDAEGFWIAMDHDGSVWAYKFWPEKGKNVWLVSPRHPESNYFGVDELKFSDNQENWEDCFVSLDQLLDNI